MEFMLNTPIIFFSDLHLHRFKAFSGEGGDDRLSQSLKVLVYLSDIAYRLGAAIGFSGDLFHDPKNLENSVIVKTLKYYKRYVEKRGIPFYAISGNHDQSSASTIEDRPSSYLHGFDAVFDTFHLCDQDYHQYGPDIVFAGVPYMSHTSEFIQCVQAKNKEVVKKYPNKFKILMLHGDLPGCPDPKGFTVSKSKHFPEKLSSMWGNFDLVVSGHIHKPTIISKKAYMLGSPIHQNEGDKKCEMGYWLLKDKKMEFFSLNDKFPCFKDSTDPNIDLEKDYVIPVEEDFVDPEEGEHGKFSTSLTTDKVVKRYFKAKGIVDVKKKKLLQNLLNLAKND